MERAGRAALGWMAASAGRSAHRLERKGSAIGSLQARVPDKGICQVALRRPSFEQGQPVAKALMKRSISDLVLFCPARRIEQLLEVVPELHLQWFDDDVPNPSAGVMDDPKDILRLEVTRKWVIDSKGQLWIGEDGTNHIDIVERIKQQGLHPLAAGKVSTNKAERGGLSCYNNQSGHYQPKSIAERIALVENVFMQVFGFEAGGNYRSYLGFTRPDGTSGYRQISIGEEGERQIAWLLAWAAAKEKKNAASQSA